MHSRKTHSREGRLEGRGFCGAGVLNNAAAQVQMCKGQFVRVLHM